VALHSPGEVRYVPGGSTEEHTRCAPEDGDHQFSMPVVGEIKTEPALAGDSPANLRIDFLDALEIDLIQVSNLESPSEPDLAPVTTLQ
jgi:hypothetical protein